MYGKPSPNGSGVGWKGWYNGTFFRSLRELSFMILLDELDIPYESAEFNKFSIKYKDWKGSERTYRPDFLVDNLYLVEIKPTKLHNSDSIKRKTASALKFVKDKGLKFILIDIEIDIGKLEEANRLGKIRWIGSYEEKFNNYCCKSL